MKICKTFNRQTVVDCDPPPPRHPPPFGENNVIFVQFHFILSKNTSMVIILTNRESINNKSSMKAFQG